MPFNESWGIWGVRERKEVQDGVTDVVRWTRRHDPTRPVIDNSGWEHVDTDVADLHTYLRTGEQIHVWWPCYRSGQTYVYDSNYPFWAQGYRYGGQPVVVVSATVTARVTYDLYRTDEGWLEPHAEKFLLERGRTKELSCRIRLTNGRGGRY